MASSLDRRWRVTAVPLMYGGSIAILFIADLLMARRFSPDVFGQYTLVRNSLPLVSALALLGLDQAMTRAYAEGRGTGLARAALKSRLPVAGLIGVSAGFVLHFGLGTSRIPAFVLAVSGMIVCSSDLAAAHLRGLGSYVTSAFAKQGHRLIWGAILSVYLLATLAGDPSLSVTLLTLPIAAIVAAAVGLRRAQSWTEEASDPAAVRSLNTMGLAFGASMISILLLDWMDQALLAALHDLDTSGTYAAARIVSVYPLLSLASIAGFLLMPELVRRRERFGYRRIRRWMTVSLISAIILGVVWGVVLTAAYPIVMDTTVSKTALFWLALVGALRLFYLIPSSFLGAFGSMGLIARSSLAALVGPLVLAGAYLGLELRVDPIDAMALALFVATATRVAIASWAALKAGKGMR